MYFVYKKITAYSADILSTMPIDTTQSAIYRKLLRMFNRNMQTYEAPGLGWDYKWRRHLHVHTEP